MEREREVEIVCADCRIIEICLSREKECVCVSEERHKSTSTG